jgi:hypothetical protein
MAQVVKAYLSDGSRRGAWSFHLHGECARLGDCPEALQEARAILAETEPCLNASARGWHDGTTGFARIVPYAFRGGVNRPMAALAEALASFIALDIQ